MKRPTIPTSSIRKAPGEKWARVPESVTFDSALKPIDIRVYAAIVNGLWRGNYRNPNLTDVAQEIGSSRSQVMRSVANLKASGHIEQFPKKIGRSVAYIITSPLFLDNSDTPMYLYDKHGGRRIV